MLEGLIIGVGVGAGLAVGLLWAFRRGKGGSAAPAVQVHSSIEELRSVGDLVVFKVVTKEIVTAAEHWFGETGKKFLRWLISEKKMAMIFEFEINFRYDLRKPEFEIVPQGDARYLLRMPPCLYDIYIRDVSFYDEQQSRLLDWLLPGFLSAAFGSGVDEQTKNRLKEEARLQAQRMAQDLTGKMRAEVESSARQTLKTLARGFGAREVTVDFGRAAPVRAEVHAAGDRAESAADALASQG